jgi:hypothetical protein
LDGAYLPKTDAGTIDGIPASMAAPAVPFMVFLIKFLLEDIAFFLLMITGFINRGFYFVKGTTR